MIWKDENNFLETIKDQKRFGVFLDMGVGKTSLLLALADQKFFDGVKKILIITPKKVSLSTWQNEIKKWKNFNYMADIVSLVEGTEAQRVEILDKTGEFCIHIISSSLTEWLYGRKVKKGSGSQFLPNLHSPSYDLVIVDECSQFKSPKSARYKALKKITNGKQLFLLSGTPFSNIKRESFYYTNGDELYYLLFLLELYDKSLTQYRNDFCFTQPWNKFRWLIHYEMYDKLIALIRTKSITKQLTMQIEQKEQIVFCESDRERFKKLKQDFILETNGLTTITASNQATMINKALQLSNGFVYDNQKKAYRFNTYKFDKLKEILSKTKDNVIIFYNFEEDKRYLLEKLRGSQLLEKKEDIDAWNQGRIPILILSPFSEKYGLNLQDGGHTIIWYGLVWSAESYSQANARLYRRGQTKDVDIYYLLAEKTYDFYVYEVIVKKTKTIDDFLSYTQNKNEDAY
jgi:SNF2 family DNA or RNA helicase